MTGLLNLYDEGTLKDFQKKGGLQNLFATYQTVNDEIQSVISEWKEVDARLVTIDAITLYKIDQSKLTAATDYDGFVSARDTSTVIATRNGQIEYKTVNSVLYYRVYIGDNYYTSAIVDGVYELVIETSSHTFESELFTPCYYNSLNLADLSCSNANVDDVTFGTNPEFTIDVTESNGVDGEIVMTVTWYLVPSETFDLIVMDEYTFWGRDSIRQETQTETITASSTEELSFTLAKILRVGTYTVEYESNIPGCSGSLTYDVAKDYFTIVSAGWQDDSPAAGFQDVDFEIVISNSDANDRFIELFLYLNGTDPVTLTGTVPGSGSLTLTKTFNVDRDIDNTLVMGGDLSGVYILNEYTPV